MIPAVVRFQVLGQAEPKGSARAFIVKNKATGGVRAAVTSDNPNLKDWEHNVRQSLQVVMRQTPRETLAAIFDGPVLVAIDFHLPRPKSLPKRVTQHVKKPDVDKLARGAIDALNTVLFKDDSQVVEVRARKVYANTSAMALIRVERVW